MTAGDCVRFVDIGGNKSRRIPKGQSKMDNPEKLTIHVIQDEVKRMLLCYYMKLSVMMIEIHQVIMKRKCNS
jgi:hypothetical protein